MSTPPNPAADPVRQHLDWAKRRALERLDADDRVGAFTSMISDLNKHEGTRPGEAELRLWSGLLHGGHLNTRREMRHWIEGF